MTNWQTKKLGDVLDKIEGGGTPSKEKPEYWNGSIPWASVKDLTTFNPKRTQDYISEEGLRNSSSKLVKAGTLITPTRMALGFTVRFDVDVAINQDLKALYPKEDIAVDYLKYWFESNRNKIEKLGVGSTVAGIQVSELKTQRISLPNKPEQERIVGVLGVWDEYIEQLERKIALKEQLKKGLMQILANDNGTVLRISDVFDFLPSYSHSKAQMTYEEGARSSIYCVHYGDIHTKYGMYISPKDAKIPHLLKAENIPEHKRLRSGDVIVADASEDYDGVGNSVEIQDVSDDIIIAGLHTFALRPKQGKIANGYGSLLFRGQKLHRELMKIATYSKVYGMTKSGFSNIKVTLPSIEEQERAIALIRALNDELDSLSAKKMLLLDQKKYLLQNLITGKIRTPENMEIAK